MANKEPVDFMERASRERPLEVERAAKSLDPDALTNNITILLKSGQMTAADYEELYNRFENNPLIRQMIGSAAEREAGRLVGKSLADRRTLLAIAYDSRTKAEELSTNDLLCLIDGPYSDKTEQDRVQGYQSNMGANIANKRAVNE